MPPGSPLPQRTRYKQINLSRVIRAYLKGHSYNMTRTSTMPTYQLNNGIRIPKVALGTWQSDPGQVTEAVKHALQCGYRHIDCAFVYGNEAEVGQGLADAFTSGIKREDVFITSKLWNTFHRDPESCLDESLRRLGLDYVDLYLMHWPVPMSKSRFRCQ